MLFQGFDWKGHGRTFKNDQRSRAALRLYVLEVDKADLIENYSDPSSDNFCVHWFSFTFYVWIYLVGMCKSGKIWSQFVIKSKFAIHFKRPKSIKIASRVQFSDMIQFKVFIWFNKCMPICAKIHLIFENNLKAPDPLWSLKLIQRYN